MFFTFINKNDPFEKDPQLSGNSQELVAYVANISKSAKQCRYIHPCSEPPVASINYWKICTSLQPDWLIDNGFFKGKSWPYSKTWYTGGGPEQGFWCCFTDRLNQAQLFKRLIMLRYIYRMIARFFVMEGVLLRVLKARALQGCVGVFSPRKFSDLKAPIYAIFSTCHEMCLRKIDLEYQNGKQLQFPIIKITESKENKSIQRLDVSGSTGPGGWC